MDERMKYKMRFVGFDEHGELKPTAPGYKKGEIRMLPLEYAQNFWWELVDPIPDLVIPDLSYEDSVFIEEDFVPPKDVKPREEESELGLRVLETDQALEDAVVESLDETLIVREVLEPVDAGDIALPLADEDVPELEGIPYEQRTIKSLKLFIKQRGGEVDSQWRKVDLIREARRLEESLRIPSESS